MSDDTRKPGLAGPEAAGHDGTARPDRAPTTLATDTLAVASVEAVLLEIEAEAADLAAAAAWDRFPFDTDEIFAAELAAWAAAERAAALTRGLTDLARHALATASTESTNLG